LLSADALATAVESVAAWNRTVVCGLRAVRRWMKDAPTGVAPALSAALRRQITEIEVACEHAEQLALARSAPSPASTLPTGDRQSANALANCALYFRHLGIKAMPEDCRDLATIIAAAIPTVDRAVIVENARLALDVAATG
jgi:hypothetical protein